MCFVSQVTAYATIRAELPAGCHRTVYICDDGKDPGKDTAFKTTSCLLLSAILCHSPVYFLELTCPAEGKTAATFDCAFCAAAKKQWVLDVSSPELMYVSGRARPAGEINGKSGNLNNALNLIYPPGVPIPLDEARRFTCTLAYGVNLLCLCGYKHRNLVLVHALWPADFYRCVTQVVAVFDADQVAKENFFVRTLQVQTLPS